MWKLFLLLLIMLGSCKSVEYVEIPVDRVKIEYRDRISRDTLISNDSIIIKERGDTVFLKKYKYLYRTKELRDTINLTDTITVVKTVEVSKEVNKLHTWQIILMILGGGVIIFSLYKGVKLIKTWI